MIKEEEPDLRNDLAIDDVQNLMKARSILGELDLIQERRWRRCLVKEAKLGVVKN